MRVPERLSYSAFSLFERDPEDYYLQHMASVRAPRQAQQRPASVGSAFDAYAKSALHAAIFGKGSNPEYEFPSLFEAQVEPHNRDWAMAEGEYVFNAYVTSGAYQTLLDLLLGSETPPRFEWTVNAEINGVPFTGKPDCQFVINGIHVVHDWKVNGYCSNSGVSPEKGYMICHDGYVDVKQSRSHGQSHKLFEASELHGLKINKFYLEHCSPKWADQLSLYGWSLGEEIGDEQVVLSIDQIVGRPRPATRPLLRVASFRARVSSSYQHELARRFRSAWDQITGGELFDEEKVDHLEEKALRLKIEDPFFNRVSRPAFWG